MFRAFYIKSESVHVFCSLYGVQPIAYMGEREEFSAPVKLHHYDGG